MKKHLKSPMKPTINFHTTMQTASINFQKRFEARRRAMQLSQRALANEVGVSINTIQSYEAGGLPRGQNFLDVAKALKCSINWLTGMNEQGECLPIDDSDLNGPTNYYTCGHSTAATENSFSLFKPRWLEDAPSVPNVDGQVRLGFPQRWLAGLATDLENVRLMKVNGSAMTPTLSNGDIALLDLGLRDIGQACLYCLKIDGHYFINRVEVRPDSQLRLINDNHQLSPPFEVPADQVEIVGRIIWASRVL